VLSGDSTGRWRLSKVRGVALPAPVSEVAPPDRGRLGALEADGAEESAGAGVVFGVVVTVDGTHEGQLDVPE
jgi:hypothetical protein